MKFLPGNTKASKLSNEQVFEIRRRWANRFVEPVRMWEMALEYGVSVNTISSVIKMLTHRGVATVESAADKAYREAVENEKLKLKLENPEAIDPAVEAAFKDMRRDEREPESPAPPDISSLRIIPCTCGLIRRPAGRFPFSDDTGVIHHKDKPCELKGDSQ